MWRRLLTASVIRCTCAGEPGVRDGSRGAPTQALAAVTGPEGQVATEAAAPGRRRHTVVVEGHPIAVHRRVPARARAAAVLVHGRTWSGVPDFELQVPGAEVVEGFQDAALRADPVRADWRGAAEWEALRWSEFVVPLLRPAG